MNNDLEKTQVIEVTQQYVEPRYVTVLDLKVCNGRCAYGHIEIAGISYVFIIMDGLGSNALKVFACPYYFDETIIYDVYFQKVNEKFHGYQND